MPVALEAAGGAFDSRYVALRDDATLRAVAMTEQGTGWSVGDVGAILHTVDGGRTWRAQDSGTTCRLQHVACLDSKRAWIVGGYHEPYTRESRGVFLWTEDGGTHWWQERIDLPFLRWVHFETPQQGTAAGDWSYAYQSCQFTTVDGGKTWQPQFNMDVPGLLDFLPGQPSLALTRANEVNRVWGDGRSESMPHPPGITALGKTSDLAVAVGPGQFLAGRADRPLANLNQREQLPLLPKTVASSKQGLVIGGFPASQLLLCPFEGTPAVVKPSVPGTIHDLAWAGERSLIAVGSAGMILLSSDSGQSWNSVRGADRRTAVLVLAEDSEQIPWSLIASESLQHGARVTLAILSEPTIPAAADRDGAAPDHRDLVAETAFQAGVSEVLWFPQDAPLQTQLAEAYSPAVICLAAGCSSGLREAVLAWKSNPRFGIQRVVQCAWNAPSDIQIDPDSALPKCGRFAGEYQRTADALCRTPFTLPRVVHVQRLWDAQPASRIDSLTSGIPVADRRAMVRSTPSGAGGNVARLQARTRYPVMVKRLLELARTSPERFDEQLRVSFEPLQGDDRNDLLERLLEETLRSGEVATWRRTIEFLGATSNSDDPLARWATRTQRMINDSREWRHVQPPLAVPATQAADVPPPNARSPFESADPTARSAVQQVANLVRSSPQSNRPSRVTVRDPHPVFLFGNREPQDPATNAALTQLTRLRASGVWRDRAQEELQALPGSSVQAMHQDIRIWPARGLRPRLDGRLDEPIWSQRTSDERVSWAYDSEFLYLAAFVPLSIPESDQVSKGMRDLPLDQTERLMIELDVDRDLCTAYRLEIDGLKRTRDSCDGFVQWQPKWYFETSPQEGGWMLEAAIHRQDLVDLPPFAGESWKVRVRTLAPGETIPTGPQINPIGWHTARFE